MSRFRLTTVSKSWIFLPIVLGLIVFAFFPVFKADFVQWDDNVHILDNPAIKSLNQDYIKKIFTETVNDIYIPLTSLSFALEYRFFGFDPFVFHLDNLLLHLGIVLFLFWIVREMGVSAFGAAVAALLFGIHPMHVESVAWVTERKDVLYGIFYAAAVLSYIKYLKSVSSNNSQIHKQRYLVLTTILGFLSILAKPMALSLPLVLLLMDWFFRWSFTRRTFIEKVPLCLLVGLAVWVTYKSFVRVPGTEAAESLLIWPWTLAFYLRQFFFPFFSVPIYRLPEPITFSNMEYLFSLIFTGVLAASLWVLRKCRWYLFAVLFFFFSIFFLLRFDASHDTNIVADRFMYLPSLGLCAFLGFGLDRIWQNVHAYKIRAAIFGLAIIFVTGVLGFKTFQQAQIWDNSVALWKHQLKYFPGEKIALNNLATVLRDEKEYKDAVEEYKKILKLKAEGADVQLSLSARQQMAKVQELVFYYTRAIETDDRFSDAYYNLGTLYKEMGHIPLALANYQRIVDIDPLYKDVYMGLGDLFREMGDAKNAVDAYQQTIKTSPDDEDVYFNVIDAINEALKEDPENIFYTQARRDLFADYVKLI
ncbi:MAG: tetratricopeptide repeat protein, partial [Candidatus Omnitrophica bacterium]|nr:tetratricopeptide repeat protein [Candidatus Omnitrophota bacterium]